VQEFDSGGESDALFGRELEAVGEVDGEAGTDTFAGAFEKVGGGLAETAGGEGGVGEDLFDEREVVAGCDLVNARGRHEEKAEGGDLRPEGGSKKNGRGSGSPGRGD
jgi:hypothetical protein